MFRTRKNLIQRQEQQKKLVSLEEVSPKVMDQEEVWKLIKNLILKIHYGHLKNVD